jgi:hypothetical protein
MIVKCVVAETRTVVQMVVLFDIVSLALESVKIKIKKKKNAMRNGKQTS